MGNDGAARIWSFDHTRKLILLITVLPLFAQREIVLQTGDGKMVSLEAPATAATDLRWILPTIDGSANDCLQTDGAGNWSFSSCGSISVSTNFDWQRSPSSPATLTNGATETITLATCPLGVKGSTVGFPFVLKGSGGTKTTLSIAGGTGDPGAASCDVKIVAPASYSAGYTIGSIDNGVTEAIYDAYYNAAGQPGSYGNVDVLIPPGRYPVYGTTQFHIAGSGQSVTIRGSGTGVTLLYRDTSFTSGDVFKMGGVGLSPGSKYILRDMAIESPQDLQVTSGAHVAVYGNNIAQEIRNLDLFNGYDGIAAYSSSPYIENVHYSQDWQHVTNGKSARYGLEITGSLPGGTYGGPPDGIIVHASTFGTSNPYHATLSLRAGIHIAKSSSVRINDFFANGWAGIIIQNDAGDATTSIQNISITKGIIDEVGYVGIYLQGTTAGGLYGNVNISIEGVHIGGYPTGSATHTNGITSAITASNLRFLNNEITGFTNGGGFQFIGGASATVDGLQVIGNSILNCLTGMQIGTNYTNTVISNNRTGVMGAFPGTMTTGLDLPAGASKVVVEGNDFSGATTPISYAGTFSDFVLKNNIGVDTVVPTVASGASIAAPLNPVAEITGVTPISTITNGWLGRKLSIIFTDNAPTGLITGGNIATAVTVTKDAKVDCIYSGSLWYCEGGGGIPTLTAQYIPYAAANGLLNNTSTWWDSANLRSTLRHTTDLGGHYIEGYGASSTIPGFQVLRAAAGTPSSPSALPSGYYLGTLAFGGYGTTTWGGATVASAAIQARATEAFTDTAKGTELLFLTTPNASVTPATRMKIDQNGVLNALFGLNVTGTVDITGAVTVHHNSYDGITSAGSSSNAVGFRLQNTYTGGRNYNIFSSGGGPAAVGSFGIWDDTAGVARMVIGSDGVLSALYGITVSNDKYIRWADSAGTVISTLGLDGSNNFHVGLQAVPASAGDTFFYARGVDAFKLIKTVGGPFILEPISDTGATTYLGIGTATKRIGPIHATQQTMYSVGGAPAFISLQTAAGGSFVNLYAGSATGGNYNLLFPSAAPGAANKILVTTAGTDNPLVWSDPTGPANMVTTDTTQTIAAIKSFDDDYLRITNTSYPAKIGRFAVPDANSDGIAVYTLPTNTAALAGLETAQTFTAAQTVSTTGANGFIVKANTAGINDIVYGPTFWRATTGTAGVGLGIASMFVLEDAGGTDIYSGAIVSRWTDPAANKREAMMEFWSSKANSLALAMSINTNGVVTTTTNLVVGGTVTASGHILPGAGSSYALGGVGNTFLGAYVDNLFVYTGITAPNSSAGLSASVNCSTPGQAVKTMTVSGGLVTAVGCAAP